MKKIFTLFAVLAAGLGIASAQTTVTWSLTDKANQLGGVANDAKITVSDATYGSGLNLGAVKNYTLGSGTLFSPTATGNFDNPKTDGSWDVTFSFEIPEGYSFKPSSVQFFSAADGSGNDHFVDVNFKNNSNSYNVVTKYKMFKSTETPETKTYSVSYDSDFEGKVDLVLNLYGKPSATTKGWTIGNMVVTGQLLDLSDTRSKANIAWDTDKVSLKVRDAFTAPVLSNPDNVPVTFTSGNTNIANVDADGVITLVEGATGTVIISATYDGEAEGAEYLTTTANVTIEVLTNRVVEKLVDPNIETITPELDAIYKANLDSYPAGEIYSDDYLTIIAHSETINGKQAKNYGGQTFTKSIQVRVNSEPSDTDPYGEEYGDTVTEERKTTSLVVKPAVDMTLYVFGRRQTIEDEALYEEIDDEENNVITCKHYFSFKANDGKSLKFDDTDEPTKILEKNVYLGEWDGTDYVYGISEIQLYAGQEYNMYAIGTTYHVNGIGYAIKRDPSEVVLRTDVIEYKENAASQTDGNGFTVSRTGGKLSKGSAKINVDGVDYTPIKMKGIVTDAKNQIVYTIAAPEGRIITKATVYAYMSYIGKEGGVDATDASQNYFSEVAGHTFVKDLHGKFANTTDVKEFTFDHIMRNSFDIKLHTNQDADICAVWVVETTHDRHAVAAPAIKLDGVDHESEEAELAGEARLLHVVPAEGHYAYFHFDYAKAETPEPEVPGHGSSDIYDSPAPAPARAEAAGDAPAQVITLNGKEFRLVPEEGIELAKNGTLAYLSHNPANGLKSELKTLSVVGTAPETTMIESVAADNAAAEVEYYNLQGIRVNNPQGGVFIRRQGNDVKKVIL